MDSIAHIRAVDGKIQTVEEHLLGVKELAERYGSKLGLTYMSGLAGVLHDMGKYTEKFKRYILEAVKNPEKPPKRGSVDHSTAGGKLLFELFHTKSNNPYEILLSEIVGNAIISHHAYLQDYLNPQLESDFLRRVFEKELPEFEMSKQFFFQKVMNEHQFITYVNEALRELQIFLQDSKPELVEEQIMFLTKFIFSVLIDADRTKTRLFEENKIEEATSDSNELFTTYYENLMQKFRSFENDEKAKTPINQLRSQMAKHCEEFAEKPSGIYTLSIPTGGGKTLASLRYALKHAKLYNKDRIIYVVPFTTIIEQNAEEVRKILMDEMNILEHHSNVIDDLNEDDEMDEATNSKKQRLKLAKDNWDSPIIFTTMVQFLDVFFAKGSRNIRRLHNVSNSVVIFDEVQKVPVSCISLFNQTLNFLKNAGNCSLILCTATQPALDFVENKLDINMQAEMVNEIDDVIEAFKRVEIVDYTLDGSVTNESLVDFVGEQIEEVGSVLVILNTKTVVRRLYNLLKEKEYGIPLYHLSTSMCAAHRNDILHKIRKHLSSGEKIICISTQLIEAGVDISFKCVIRSLAGLDSIAQAAGRCNRHGENKIQNVYLIDHEEEKLDKLKEIKIGKNVTKRVLKDMAMDEGLYGGDILSRQAMMKYFQEFYTEVEADVNYFIPKLRISMTELLNVSKCHSKYHDAYLAKENQSLELILVNSYNTAAKHFRVIDNVTTSVLVPYHIGNEIITEFNGAESIDGFSKLIRKAQHYSINLFQYELDLLSKNGGIVSMYDGKVLALKENAYDEEFGLNVENDSNFGLSIF